MFIQLAEETERLDGQGLLTLEEKAIKEYAFLCKLQEVATKLNEDGLQLDNKPITAAQVTAIIKIHKQKVRCMVLCGKFIM